MQRLKAVVAKQAEVVQMSSSYPHPCTDPRRVPFTKGRAEEIHIVSIYSVTQSDPSEES